MLYLWVHMEGCPPVQIPFPNKSTVLSLRQEVCKKRWEFIFPGATMENAALFRIENVALKEFKAELNDYEHLVELKDDHTPLIKYEWLDDSVHVVIKNPKLETKRSSVESALTSFQDGKNFNFIICIGEQVQFRFASRVTRKELEYLLMHILQKNMDYINGSIKITELKYCFGFHVEYLVANDADVVEELAKKYGPNPPRTKALLPSLKRKFGEGSKDKEVTTSEATENPSAPFNLSSRTDPFGEMQQQLRSDLHMRDRGCVVTKSPECVASHIIDYARQKVPGLQGLPESVKEVIQTNGINSPCNAILLNKEIDGLFDSKKLSIVPVDAQGLPIPWPLFVKESNMNEKVPASYKLWAFNDVATQYHLKPVLFEPYVLNADNLPEFPHPILMQQHFMQSLFFNLQGGGSFESDDDDDDNDNIVCY